MVGCFRGGFVRCVLLYSWWFDCSYLLLVYDYSDLMGYLGLSLLVYWAFVCFDVAFGYYCLPCGFIVVLAFVYFI